MEKVYRRYKDKGLAVLGICTSGTKSETRDLVDEMNLTFTMAHDFDDVYSKKFGADSEPILVLLDKNLKIVDIYNDIYPSELKEALNDLDIRSVPSAARQDQNVSHMR